MNAHYPALQLLLLMSAVICYKYIGHIIIVQGMGEVSQDYVRRWRNCVTQCTMITTTTHYWLARAGCRWWQLLMAGDRRPVTIIITSQCTQCCTAVQRLECRHYWHQYNGKRNTSSTSYHHYNGVQSSIWIVTSCSLFRFRKQWNFLYLNCQFG